METKLEGKFVGVSRQGMLKEIETTYHLVLRPFKSLIGVSKDNSYDAGTRHEAQKREVEFWRARAQAGAYRIGNRVF